MQPQTTACHVGFSRMRILCHQQTVFTNDHASVALEPRYKNRVASEGPSLVPFLPSYLSAVSTLHAAGVVHVEVDTGRF